MAMLLLFGGPATAQSDDTTTVTLVHGFRGLLADVYLDGERVLEGFKPARSTSSSSEQLPPPARINADSDVVTALYLIGSADNDSLGWLSQRLHTSSGTTPAGVPTGDSGLADASRRPWWSVAATASTLPAGLWLTSSAVALAPR